MVNGVRHGDGATLFSLLCLIVLCGSGQSGSIGEIDRIISRAGFFAEVHHFGLLAQHITQQLFRGFVHRGITIGKNDRKALLSPRYLRMPLLRNVLMPLITIPILYFLPLDPAVAKIVVVYSALPVASMLNAFTIQYDPGEPEAMLESAGSVFYSTLLCAVTIPLWAQAAEMLF